MHVRVKKQRLSPGMKHGQCADANTQPARSDIDERGSGSAKEQVVKQTRRVPRDGVQLVRHCEHDVEVRNRQ